MTPGVGVSVRSRSSVSRAGVLRLPLDGLPQVAAHSAGRERALILAPPGFRHTDNPATWRAHARALVADNASRRDLRATLLALVDALAVSWHPSTLVSSPGHGALEVAAGRSQSAVARGLARLASWGLVAESAPGTIVWAGEGGQVRKLRAEYALLLPSRRAEAVGGWSLCRAPRTKGERLAAAEALRRQCRATLGQGSTRALASALGEWFAAGWTPADVLRALDCRPDDGGVWTFTTEIRSVVSWVRFRLSYWRDSGGLPRRSVSQVTDAERERLRLAAAARQRQAEADAADRAQGLSEAARQAIGAVRSVLRSGSARAQKADPSLLSTLVESPLARARDDEPTAPAAAGWTAYQAARQNLARARQQQAQLQAPRPPSLDELRSQRVPGLFLRTFRVGTVSPSPDKRKRLHPDQHHIHTSSACGVGQDGAEWSGEGETVGEEELC